MRILTGDMFANAARDAGDAVTVGVLPPLGDDRAERADCGCSRFYRETTQTN